MYSFDDRLSIVGGGLGALLVLVGLGTLLGQPWTYEPTATLVAKLVGVLVAVAVGIGLAWLSVAK